MYKSLFLIFLLFLVSCSSHELDVLFDQAARNIQPEPEKAYALLTTIDSKNISSRSQQARYALLLSHAMYKCYYDAPNDSLISIAYDYYVTDGHGSDHDRMTAAMLRGAVLYNINRRESSMSYYKTALNYGEKTDDYFMMGQIYSHLTALCLYIFDSDELHYAEKASEYYEKAGILDYYIDSKAVFADILYSKGDYSRCLSLSDSVYKEAVLRNDTITQQRCLRNLMLCNMVLSRFAEARESYDELHKLQKEDLMTDLISLSAIYANTGAVDSAFQCISSVDVSQLNSFDQINYYQHWSLINEKLGKPGEALEQYRKMHYLKDSVMTLRLSQSVNATQRDYIQKELQMEKYKQKTRLAIWSLIVLALLFMVIIGAFHIRRKVLVHRYEMDRYVIMVEDIERNIENKQNAIEKLRKEVTEIKKDNLEANRLVTTLLEKRFSALDGLFISYFTGQNPFFEKNSIYKEVKRIVEGVINDENMFFELESMVNRENRNILSHLYQDFPKMSPQDYKFLCYSLVGLSSRTISLMLKESVDNIYQKRTRWRNRIEASSSERKNEYLSLFFNK